MQTNALQKREVFHLTFLRALVRAIPLSAKFAIVLKGGCNLRFFFGSVRYSEDMDLDASGVSVDALREKVMAILRSPGFVDALRIFSIAQILPPNISRAKQTETVQRFKVHLLTEAGEDLYTKIEFSRRGLDSPVQSEAVPSAALAVYRMPPLIVPHYPAVPAARQKIHALLSRRETQARDVFDLHMLSTRPELLSTRIGGGLSRYQLKQTLDRVYRIEYAKYRDTVVAFLAPEDREALGSNSAWDEIRLSAAALIERQMTDA